MKENECFDNTLFRRILCVLAALALIFVIILLLIRCGSDIGTPGEPGESDRYEEWTFAPDSSTQAPVTTEAPATTASPDTTAAPGITAAPGTTAAPNTTAAPATTADPTTPTKPVLTPLPESPLILGETPDAGQAYQDCIVFVGDSTTYGMIPYAVLAEGKLTKQVWTPSSGTLTLDQAVKKKIYFPDADAEVTIAEAAGVKQPAFLVITLGVNGVSFMSEEQFITEYTKLVQSIQVASPYTMIILQSIFPVASNYDKLDRINNDKISLANTWVLKVAEECSVPYLDTASVLYDADGWLHASFQNGDGMHLNETGFRTVLNYIRTHAHPAVGGDER